MKMHRLIHVNLLTTKTVSDFFHILQHKVTVKHKPKIAEDDVKQA